MPSNRVELVIDQSALRHNLSKLRARCQNSKIMAVIKADGYGHGIELVADALSDADEFAVSDHHDLQRLRSNGIEKTVTLLSAYFDLKELKGMLDHNVRPTIYDISQVEIFEQLRSNKALSVWIKIDTGMSRLGISEGEVSEVYKRLAKLTTVKDISLMTHLANADDLSHPLNSLQVTKFKNISSKYAFKDLSILNSAGVVNFPNNALSIVRPGIMLYGISPIKGKSADDLGLKAVMTLKSQLISLKHLSAGTSIGYGSDFVLENDSKIGIVSCGYADGYPRNAPSGTPVLVNGRLVSLIGRVSMDMLAVDLSGLPVDIGDEVVLWGEGNPVEKIAEAAQTIPYTLCSGILPRVNRIAI